MWKVCVCSVVLVSLILVSTGFQLDEWKNYADVATGFNFVARIPELTCSPPMVQSPFFQQKEDENKNRQCNIEEEYVRLLNEPQLRPRDAFSLCHIPIKVFTSFTYGEFLKWIKRCPTTETIRYPDITKFVEQLDEWTKQTNIEMRVLKQNALKTIRAPTMCKNGKLPFLINRDMATVYNPTECAWNVTTKPKEKPNLWPVYDVPYSV